MNRRTLFSLLAAIPGFAFFKPKAVEAKLQKQEPEEDLGWYGKPPPHGTHTEIVKLFQDVKAFVREYPGARVLCADLPQWGFMGYCASKQVEDREYYRHFTISFKDLRADIENQDPARAEVIRTYIKTNAGRNRIAQWLETPHTTENLS